MIQVYTFLPSDYFGSNCYVINADGEYAVVDPSVDYSVVSSKLGNICDSVKYILLTHCHFDHIAMIDSWVTGMLFIIGLLIASRWAALWAAIGSAVAIVVASAFSVSGYDIAHGLYGFSAVLTAIALATVFYRPGWRSALWATMGVVITVVSQAAMNVMLDPFGLSSLTAPFCITTWVFLLPLFKFDSTTPDHSHWSPSLKQHLQ